MDQGEEEQAIAGDSRRLARLSELSDYRVAGGDPDPRGWNVVAGDGQRVGRVDELIVEPEAERARYLDVHLDQDAEHRHVLIPTNAVRIGDDERQRQEVKIGASADFLTAVTAYRGLPLTSEQEAEYRACPPAGPTSDEPGHTRITRGGMRHD